MKVPMLEPGSQSDQRPLDRHRRAYIPVAGTPRASSQIAAAQRLERFHSGDRGGRPCHVVGRQLYSAAFRISCGTPRRPDELCMSLVPYLFEVVVCLRREWASRRAALSPTQH